MKVGVPKEITPGEKRVALVPDTATKLKQAGFEVTLASGAGAEAFFPDELYQKVGVGIVTQEQALGADVVLKVQPPTTNEVRSLKEGALLISFLQPSSNAEVINALAQGNVTAVSLELVPRISRAQSMDALSSQANVGGYKAVLMAASRLGKFFPMLITAAGTIPPARVLVLGVGVAGLQAIATARRLGGVVEAYDVRPAVKEQVQSLGATFVELPLEAQEGAGGYAREQSEDFLRRQRELIGDRVAAADVVITTAAIPGRRAPILVTGDMVKRMRPGSVIVDLASETGGNCELTRAGEVIEVNNVFIDGTRNIPSTMPLHSSQLYARNLMNLLLDFVKNGQLQLNFDDEILKGATVTRAGEIVNPQAKQMMAPAKTA
jgi:NAD(P) transhydrogenase subunit alpha